MIPPSKSLKSALLFLFVILSGVLAAAAAKRPNILWIFSEDLSPYMGCYGDPINTGHTPSIDALASQGVLFKHAYMPAPVCSPCRSAMITGVMQTTTGTHQHRSSRAPEGKVDSKTFIKLPAGMKTIPELMREAGYFTFNSGKDDYTIDRIRTVRTGKLRYIRNFFPERTMLQPQYRDHAATVKDLKRLHKAGKLTAYQEKFWFGVRPKEELYDLAKDPFQMHNLAGDPAFGKELERHRKILEGWIRETGDKGQFPEDPVQLKATYDLWKTRPIFRNAKVNPEYDQFRK